MHSNFENSRLIETEESSRIQLVVVTPTWNGEAFLNETISSIAAQSGNFDLHYHVQDGLSTDGTIKILQQWSERFVGTATDSAPRVQFSWASEKDAGMYDAINKGFAHVLTRLRSVDPARVIMTWINSDDLLAVSALRTVARFFDHCPDKSWMTGIATVAFSDGAISDTRETPWGASTRYLAAGLYDGRTLPVVQQEGTFWRQTLWNLAGEADASLRLAGDWDLWRRFAGHSDLVTFKAVLGIHRRHAGQLSEDMGKYWREVDDVKTRASLDEAIRQIDHGNPDVRTGWVAGWDSNISRYSVYKVEVPAPRIVEIADDGVSTDLFVCANDATLRAQGVELSGMSAPEHWGRWSDSDLAPSLRVRLLEPLGGPCIVTLRLRVIDAQNNPLVVRMGPECWSIEATGEFQDYKFTVRNGVSVSSVDVQPAAARSPYELGFSNDTRRIAVGLEKLSITPVSVVDAPAGY
jgi:hypothetical protein